MFINKRGTVLIMTMMAICLTFMMVNVLMQTTGYGLSSTSGFYDREAALQAAQSGVDYAVTRLQHNAGWRGDSNCKYWNGSDVAEKIYGSLDNGLMVAESNGNVVGLLTDKAGHITGFRIKFSYETNATETYDKAERSRFGQKNSSDYLPSTDYRIHSPYVSVNNLISKTATLVYRADSGGIGVSPKALNLEVGQEINDTEREFAFHLPAQRISLVVEGLSGKGLRDCKTPADINAAANSGINVARRYIEACYSDIAPVIDGDAAFAQDSIDIAVKNKLFVSTNIQTFSSDASQQKNELTTVPAPGSLRSRNSSISVTGGKLNTYNGKLIRPKDSTSSFTQDEDYYTFLDANGQPQRYQFPNTGIETSNSKVEDIDWKHVAKAENKGKTNNVTPGFYQWHPAPNSTAEKPAYQLRYYKDGYELDDKGRPIPKNPANFQIAVAGEVANNDPGVEINGTTVSKISIGPREKVRFITDAETGNITEPTLSLAGKLFCNGDFTVGSDVTTVTNVCPKVLVTAYTESTSSSTPESSGEENSSCEDGVFTSAGDVFIASSLFGSGAIVTEHGDVTFMGGSVLESGSCGVAIYGKNVTLKSLDGAVAAPPKGSSLDHDISQEPAGNYTLNNDGSMNISPGNDYYTYLNESFENNYHQYNSRDASAHCYQDIEDYFAKLGAHVNVENLYKGQMFGGGNLYGMQVTCINQDNNNPDGGKYTYAVIVTNTGVDIYNSGFKFVPPAFLQYNPFAPASNITVPDYAVLPTENELKLPEEAQQAADTFGSVCYGDQTFKGIIYARDNFTADLGEDFSLTVTGAIRAEKGKITANCKGASFAYDETYLKTLLPSYSKIVCKMWNCW